MKQIIELDHIDLQTAAFCVDYYLRDAKKRWVHLDQLYSDKAYAEQELARHLFKTKAISEEQLKTAWDDLDSRMAIYDDKCMERRELAKYLRVLIRRLRMEGNNVREK